MRASPNRPGGDLVSGNTLFSGNTIVDSDNRWLAHRHSTLECGPFLEYFSVSPLDVVEDGSGLAAFLLHLR